MGYVGAASGRHYHQRATYWAPGSDDGYGSNAWAAPSTMDCRWEDLTEEKLSSSGGVAGRGDGETILSSAMVFTKLELAEGGYLYLGETASADPTSIKGAFPIRRTSVIPDLRGNQFENVSYL